MIHVHVHEKVFTLYQMALGYECFKDLRLLQFSCKLSLILSQWATTLFMYSSFVNVV